MFGIAVVISQVAILIFVATSMLAMGLGLAVAAPTGLPQLLAQQQDTRRKQNG